MHGDPSKAGSIMRQMKGCDILLGHAMGPNFIRMRDESPFIPVISRRRNIEEVLSALKGRFEFLSTVIEAKKSGKWDKKPIILE